MQGSLPWSNEADRKNIYKAKCDISELEKFCVSLPPEILDIYRCIDRLKYEEEPNYKLLESFLVKAMRTSHPPLRFDLPFDWENLSGKIIERLGSLVDLKIDPLEKSRLPTKLVPAVVPGNQGKKKRCSVQ
jgi:hypothetical protein